MSTNEFDTIFKQVNDIAASAWENNSITQAESIVEREFKRFGREDILRKTKIRQAFTLAKQVSASIISYPTTGQIFDNVYLKRQSYPEFDITHPRINLLFTPPSVTQLLHKEEVISYIHFYTLPYPDHTSTPNEAWFLALRGFYPQTEEQNILENKVSIWETIYILNGQNTKKRGVILHHKNPSDITVPKFHIWSGVNSFKKLDDNDWQRINTILTSIKLKLQT